MTVVLDSWAVLAYLQDQEPAADMVQDLLEHERPVMNWINLGEVLYVLRRRHDAADAEDAVHDLRTHVDSDGLTTTRILQAARLKADFAMSYADAFAAATAIACGAEIWTGDPELLIDDALWRWRDLRQAH